MAITHSMTISHVVILINVLELSRVCSISAQYSYPFLWQHVLSKMIKGNILQFLVETVVMIVLFLNKQLI